LFFKINSQMKNVLVIYYSQSGQLKSIARNISKSLQDDKRVNLVFHEIEMEKPFPFPWNEAAFFDAFPESFLQIPTNIKPIPESILNTKYDLVLLHYQVWYLSPSIPINSFLKSPEAKIILNNTPTITINGSRNMWIMAQEKVKVALKQNNAILKGNIALVDRVGNLISVITIVKWLFSGVKNKYLGVFPLPGVSEKDIQESSKFGKEINEYLHDNTSGELQPRLVTMDAVRISPYLVKLDKTANKIFNKWANFIKNKKESRKTWLKVFKIYLLFAIWIISPIVYILHIFTYPFSFNKRKKEKHYYQEV
jgi:hypothetical protein